MQHCRSFLPFNFWSMWFLNGKYTNTFHQFYIQASFNQQSFKSDKVSSQEGLGMRSHESARRPSDLASLPKYDKIWVRREQSTFGEISRVVRTWRGSGSRCAGGMVIIVLVERSRTFRTRSGGPLESPF